MKKSFHRLSALILAFVLVMSELSVPVYATETEKNVAAEEVLTDTEEAADDTDDTKKLITSDESAETEKTADADEQAESEETADDKATDDASESSATEEEEAEHESEDDSFFAEEDEVVPEADIEDGSENDGDEELHGLGYNYIPGEGDVESIEVYGDDDEFQDININDPLPSSYVTADLPNLRNQGGYGTCWAHSAMATAEINKMKQNYDPSLNYSELHLAYFTYEKKNSADPLGGTTGDKNEAKYDSDGPDFMQRGGNHEFASNVLASWIGAADESKAPYGYATTALSSGLDESIAYDDAAHLKNFYKVNTGDLDAIKRIVRDCGAAEISFFAIQRNKRVSWNDGKSLSFSDVYKGGSEYNCYYFPLENRGTNHSVTIVGWDDNFPATKFARTPGGNGAWLIRNSWSSGDISNKSFEGYFWLSYYDKSIATTSAWGYEYSDTVYDHNYQYDGAMNTGWTTYGSSQIYSANVFTAKGNPDGEILRSVGINTYKNTNVSYEVKVYKNLSNAKVPTSGTCVSSVTGKTTYCGFYTVPLTTEVELDPGDVFSIVVKFQKSGDKVYAATEYTDTLYSDWYKITASSKAGQSFLSYNGSSWEDYGASGNGNIRIKAFTSNDTGNKVTVTLNAEGGKFSDGQSVMKKTVHPEESYGSLPTPTKANCEFIGWFLEDGVTKITESTTVPADATDHTLHAHWKGKTINVTLNPKGGKIDGSTANKTVQVRYGETYGTLPPPQYAGYDFKGWFTSASGTEKVKADTVVTKTSDHTLYAQYNANKYIVTYDPDGGTISEPSKEVTFGSKYGTLPTPVKNGYTFAGWFTAKTGGVQVKADTLVSSDNLDVNAGTHCLYARWNAKTITVSLDAGEGTCSKKNLTVTFAGKYTNLPDATPPDGMEFVGWFTDGNTNITADSTVTIASNHTLTARYRGDEVIVTFDVNGGSALPAEKRSKTVYVADTYGTLPVPTRTDHDFTGWYTKAEGGSRIFGSTTVTIGSAHTLYAHWKAKTCKVTLDANGGLFDDGTDKTVLEVQKNEVLLVSDLNSSYRPYYARHKFKKWSDSATVTVTADMTLTAAWDAIGEEESEYRVEGLKAEGYEYTGAAIKPGELGEIVVYDNSVSSDRPLVEKVDYTLSYQNNKDVADKSARKAPTLIIKGKGNYEKSQEVKFSIVPVSIGDGNELKKGFSVTIADKQSDGTSEQKPKPTIKYGKTSLKEGKDYKITGYDGDVINPGTPSVCVEAIGTNFTGTARISYQIYDKDSNIGKMFVKAIPDQPYTGTEIADFTAFFTSNNIVVKPKQTSSDSDILRCGTDYEVSYSPGTNRTEAGTVSLNIVGKGAFTGRKTVSFRIIPKDVSTCNVTVDDTGIVYNGKAQKPPVKVTIGSKELTEGTDYTLSYTRNTNAGAAALGESKAPMVTVKGRGNYKGAKKKTFTIGAIAVDRSELDVSVANVKVKEKAVTAKDIKATIKYFDPLRGKTVSMSKDKDFVIKSFSYAAGRQKQEIEFKLTGNYQNDSITAEFVAYKDNIPVDGTFKAKLADPGAVYEYTGEQIKPAITVTRTSGEDVITLVEGRDFKVSYSNNKNAAARTSSRAPMWTVTGTGAYKGTIGTGRFPIEKAVLSGENYELQVPDVKQSSKPGEPKVKVISRSTGKALSSSDYTCTYSDNTGRTDHAKVKVNGKGNFFSPEGEELVSEFRIYGTDISKLSFDKIPDQKYEGKTVKPAVVIKDRSTSYTLVPGVDYELKYGQNIRTGTGTVTINGIGIYGGSKTLSFKIKPKPIENKN